MAATIFGYLLATADASLFTLAFILLYLARHSTNNEVAFIDHLSSSPSWDAMAQNSSNTSTPDWKELRRRA